MRKASLCAGGSESTPVQTPRGRFARREANDRARRSLRSAQAVPGALAYFKCLPTSLVISNMLTEAFPPKTALSVASALIIRLFFASCSLFFLM